MSRIQHQNHRELKGNTIFCNRTIYLQTSTVLLSFYMCLYRPVGSLDDLHKACVLWRL